MVRVKVFGITNYEDATLAADLGAHPIGFVFAPSPRRVSLQHARQIIRRLPPFMTTVGVFVNENPETVIHVKKPG